MAAHILRARSAAAAGGTANQGPSTGASPPKSPCCVRAHTLSLAFITLAPITHSSHQSLARAKSSQFPSHPPSSPHINASCLSGQGAACHPCITFTWCIMHGRLARHVRVMIKCKASTRHTNRLLLRSDHDQELGGGVMQCPPKTPSQTKPTAARDTNAEPSLYSQPVTWHQYISLCARKISHHYTFLWRRSAAQPHCRLCRRITEALTCIKPAAQLWVAPMPPQRNKLYLASVAFLPNAGSVS
jgi:hypothetical protein